MTDQRDEDVPRLVPHRDPPAIPRIWTRRDQWAIGVTACGCLVAMGVWSIQNGGLDRLWLDDSALRPRPVRLQLHWSSATWPELTLVPGIGETLAGRIIEQRRRHGILTLQNLADVRGIGETKLATLLQYLTVASSDELPAPAASVQLD